MHCQHTTLASRPQASRILVRPVDGPWWLPTSFRSLRRLYEYLDGSDFLVLPFRRRGVWLITPDGLPLEVRTSRYPRGALAP